jgi:hypothetical protein
LSPTLEHNHSISRREFTREWVLAMLAGAVITITGCSDSPTEPSQGGSGGGGGSSTQDVSGVVSANHGHIATVTGVKITAGAAIANLDIMGTATHTHTVSLTASQVQQIGTRQQVAVTSTTDAGHQHTVTFN